MKCSTRFAWVIAALLLPAAATQGADSYVPFEGEKTTWHDGFDRFDYEMDEATLAITPFKRDANERFGVKNPEKGKRRCIVVVPKQAAAGNPWSWQGCYWDHEPQAEVELLRRGFHIAFITPDPGKQWDAWYDFLTEKHGLAKKCAFDGMSRGGINAYWFAGEHPDRVACIYADNPAIRPEDFAKLNLLAKADIALLNVCGTQDFLLQRHTLAIERRYHELNGQITVMIKDGPAHHPHSLRNPKPIADFIVEHTKPAAPRPSFANDRWTKGYYYSDENSYLPLKEEKTFVTCRGPGFVPSYVRYDSRADSRWGLISTSVVVPNNPAPGKPWVMRADTITRDASVDQELLAKGFHIVVTPMTAQAGPVKAEWDATYKLMVDNGLSPRPVLEGIGTSGGECYAWAIANPDKVSCIYVENAAIRSLMSKKQPMEGLDVLAKAGIPLIHSSGSKDPWLESETRAVEKKIKELGSSFTVFVDEGRGHYPTSPRDAKPVVAAILDAQAKTPAAKVGDAAKSKDYKFDKVMSREVLENYLDRSISMEGLLNGRGDLNDNIRMLKTTEAKFIGRALCLWGQEANLIKNLERARQQVPQLHAADPEMILQACIFEIVTTQVDQVPVPDWAFVSLGMPVEKRKFRYADMLYPDGKRKDHWRAGNSVPDVSRPETKLWFYFLGASYIDVGIEAIHFGQTELMNGNDRDLKHYSQVLSLIREHAVKKARRHMIVCDSHVPSGGLVREGTLLMDFHSFPLRIMETPDKPKEAILKVGFSDGIYGRSKGGMTYSGWSCEHLPFLVEIDNWGSSRKPGEAKQGSIWVWGWDEITWFAHQPEAYRAKWLRYAWNWVRETDPNGHFEMPGSRTLSSRNDGKRWYFANASSKAVPEGLNDEVAIRDIWRSDVKSQ